ncbi:MAG: AAA family ATPase [Candidatus Pacearchaeota archaeon]|nr:MAG: AAA family ATPase [Candidatus Pacearchaeota archaeon]
MKKGVRRAKKKAAKAVKRVRELKLKPREYFKTNIQGFDKLLEKGVPVGSSVLVEGGPGSGKTIFCLQLAYNACKQGKKVLYMSFEEPESRLRRHMRAFGWHPDEFEKKDLLRIKRYSALDISRSVEALLSEAKKELLIDIQPVFFPPDFKPDIVCIDSLTSIASAFSGEEARFRVYMEQLFRYLEKTEITSFLIREVSNPTHIGTVYVERAEAVSFLSDGIIIIYNVIYGNGRRGSAVEILKMRGENIKRKIVAMEIKQKKGIIVYPEKEVPIGTSNHVKHILT